MARRAPWAEAIGVRNERIEAVGTAEEVTAAVGTPAKVVDVDGAILPAFIDAHHHFCLAAFDRRAIDLRLPPGSSMADLLVRVEQAVAEHTGGWLRPRGAHAWEPRAPPPPPPRARAAVSPT